MLCYLGNRGSCTPLLEGTIALIFHLHLSESAQYGIISPHSPPMITYQETTADATNVLV